MTTVGRASKGSRLLIVSAYSKKKLALPSGHQRHKASVSDALAVVKQASERGLQLAS